MQYIQLTQDNRAMVDDNLFDWLNQWKWYYKKGYAVRNEYGKNTHQTIGMHAVINQTPTGNSTDHINGDKLDNRAVNLRTCNSAENGWNRKRQKNNTSGHKGIYWHKRDKRWRVQIRVDGKKKFIGNFMEIDDAVIARDVAVLKYHGVFANAG